jgi:hypothetical protein
MTEDELDRLADKIAARIRPAATIVNTVGSYVGTRDDLAQIIRDAARRSIPPKTGAA